MHRSGIAGSRCVWWWRWWFDHPNTYPDANADTHSYAYSHTNADTNADTNTDANACDYKRDDRNGDGWQCFQLPDHCRQQSDKL